MGLLTDPYGSVFETRSATEPEKENYTVWSPFKNDTDYFKPSEKEFMINYRVDNIEELIAELKENGVEVVAEIVSYDYGEFVHILDPEGNKIELWETIDEVFTKMYKGKTTK